MMEETLVEATVLCTDAKELCHCHIYNEADIMRFVTWLADELDAPSNQDTVIFCGIYLQSEKYVEVCRRITTDRVKDFVDRFLRPEVAKNIPGRYVVCRLWGAPKQVTQQYSVLPKARAMGAYWFAKGTPIILFLRQAERKYAAPLIF